MNQQPRYTNRQRSGRYRRSPHSWYFWLSMSLLVALAAGLSFLKLPIYLAYIISLNLVIFGLYGYDKFQARRNGGRVPERILHYLALIGGPVGGIAGQWVFLHKIRKRNFHLILWASLLVHVIIFALFYKILLSNTNWQAAAKDLTDFLNSRSKR